MRLSGASKDKKKLMSERTWFAHSEAAFGFHGFLSLRSVDEGLSIVLRQLGVPTRLSDRERQEDEQKQQHHSLRHAFLVMSFATPTTWHETVGGFGKRGF